MFTTMCPKEQQTRDDLIVNHNCLSSKCLINLALKFNGTRRGFFSYLNKA